MWRGCWIVEPNGSSHGFLRCLCGREGSVEDGFRRRGKVGWLGGWMAVRRRMFAACGLLGSVYKIPVDVLCSIKVIEVGCSSTCSGTCSGPFVDVHCSRANKIVGRLSPYCAPVQAPRPCLMACQRAREEKTSRAGTKYEMEIGSSRMWLRAVTVAGLAPTCRFKGVCLGASKKELQSCGIINGFELEDRNVVGILEASSSFYTTELSGVLTTDTQCSISSSHQTPRQHLNPSFSRPFRPHPHPHEPAHYSPSPPSSPPSIPPYQSCSGGSGRPLLHLAGSSFAPLRTLSSFRDPLVSCISFGSLRNGEGRAWMEESVLLSIRYGIPNTRPKPATPIKTIGFLRRVIGLTLTWISALCLMYTNNLSIWNN